MTASSASTSPADQSSYIAAEVRRHDRDRFLTGLLAPASVRDALWALTAFYGEVARIRDGVSEPLLGHMKIQWWRDVLEAVLDGRGAPAGHPVAQAFAAVVSGHRLTAAWLRDILTARDEELDRTDISNMAALEDFTERTAVRLAWLGLDILGVGDAVSRDAVKHAAMAYGLLGQIRAVPFHTARGRLLLPRDLMDRNGLSLAVLRTGEGRSALCEVTAEIAARAAHHLNLVTAVGRMADPQATPVLLLSTLARGVARILGRTGFDAFDRRVLAYRAGVAPLMWAAFRRRF